MKNKITLRHITLISCVLLGILLVLTNCSTRKNTGINRAYHRTTSHFNINFNAKEALKQAEATLAEKQKDNYTTQLPVYFYPPKEQVSAASSSLDRTIEKASKSIFKHSIFIKGKEYVKTMDDAYLLMGKAYFYKQDYSQAQRVFSYILTTHKNGNCREEAAVWLTRCFIRQKYFPRAESSLDEALTLIYPKHDKKLNVLYYASAAEYYLTAPNGDKEAAIDQLQKALQNKPKKEFRTRIYFILGQLYESLERTEEAHAAFLKVVKSSPSYEMEFAARMHLASNYDGTQASKNAILKEMRKMLRETKNEKFKDQIYYAISQMYKIDEDVDGEIEYLQKSVAAYVDNDYQRSYSALKLADLYFEQEDYTESQAYYDTATLALPKDYPNYKEIMNKAKILKDLVQNLQVVQTQDSLQRIAKMPAAERQAWVNRMVTDYKRAEAKRKQDEANKELAIQNALGMANVNPTANNGGNGKWYFYNPTLVSAGRTEFIKKWGSRKLEDNWRVSNKQQISFENMNAEAEQSGTDEELAAGGRSNDPSNAKYYLQDVPLTQGAMDTSNNKVANAMYNAALIYLDLLNDQKKGNELLEKLIARHPEHELALPSLYILYLNYSNAKDARAEAMKTVILNKYPNTDYAKLVKDPKYNEKLAEATKVMERKYEQTYDAYSKKQWKNTITLADEALATCQDRVLQSKFAYLKAVAVGQTQGDKALKEAMFNIVQKYGDTDVASLARLFIEPEKQPQSEKKNEKKEATTLNKQVASTTEEGNPFVLNPTESHFVIMIVNVHKIKGSIIDLKDEISAFDKEFYSLVKLNISSIYINQNEQILTIAKFKNQEAAMEYYNNLIGNDRFSAYVKSKAIRPFAISATNYTTYYNRVSMRDKYDDFFKENYLQKKN